jgi:hypothetical protein
LQITSMGGYKTELFFIWMLSKHTGYIVYHVL